MQGEFRRTDSTIKLLTIAAAARAQLRQDLRDCGITESVISRDLDGLGREMEQLWEDRRIAPEENAYVPVRSTVACPDAGFISGAESASPLCASRMRRAGGSICRSRCRPLDSARRAWPSTVPDPPTSSVRSEPRHPAAPGLRLRCLPSVRRTDWTSVPERGLRWRA